MRWLTRLAALYFAWIWASGIVLTTFERTSSNRDLVLYYRAAQNASAGRALYQSRPDYGPDSKPFEYLYPPPFAALIAPLSRLSWLQFARAWTAMLVAAFFAYAAVLMRLSGRRDAWSWLIALAAIVLFPGSYRALGLGQIDPLLWLCVGASALFAGKPTSGALLGAASLVKIYSFWPLLALRRDEGRAQMWRGALFVGAAGLALGALVCGPSSYLQWARAVLPEASQGTFNPDNVSLAMAGLRAAQTLGWHYAGGPLVGAPKLWLSAFAIAGPLAAIGLTRRLDARARIALVSCAAAWCAPLCWTTYLPLALVPLALGLRAVARRIQGELKQGSFTN